MLQVSIFVYTHAEHIVCQAQRRRRPARESKKQSETERYGNRGKSDRRHRRGDGRYSAPAHRQPGRGMDPL